MIDDDCETPDKEQTAADYHGVCTRLAIEKWHLYKANMWHEHEHMHTHTRTTVQMLLRMTPRGLHCAGGLTCRHKMQSKTDWIHSLGLFWAFQHINQTDATCATQANTVPVASRILRCCSWINLCKINQSLHILRDLAFLSDHCNFFETYHQSWEFISKLTNQSILASRGWHELQ